MSCCEIDTGQEMRSGGRVINDECGSDIPVDHVKCFTYSSQSYTQLYDISTLSYNKLHRQRLINIKFHFNIPSNSCFIVMFSSMNNCFTLFQETLTALLLIHCSSFIAAFFQTSPIYNFTFTMFHYQFLLIQHHCFCMQCLLSPHGWLHNYKIN